jgi:hypothetical protein
MSDEGHRIHVDPEAASADPELPAFIARPPGEPVYYGFPLLDVEVEGFRLGAISGFAIDELADSEDDGTSGDAFVVGPDGRRAGLAWDVAEEPYFLPIVDGLVQRVQRHLPRRLRGEHERVGVYAVGFLRPMRSLGDARENLAAIVPMLKREWER